MRFLVAAVAAITLIFSGLRAPSASAQPSTVAPGQVPPYAYYGPQPVQTKTTTYGTHVMMMDAAVLLSIGALSGSDNEAAGGLLFAAMILGGPVIHLGHDNARGAGYSLAARAGLPLGGMLLGGMMCSDEQRDEFFGCLGPIALGAVLGYGSALILDWTVFARKTEVVQPTGFASMRPVIQLNDGGAQAGLGFDF